MKTYKKLNRGLVQFFPDTTFDYQDISFCFYGGQLACPAAAVELVSNFAHFK